MKPSCSDKYFVCTALTVISLSGANARAAVIFTETADNPFYDSPWTNGSSQPNNFSWFTTTSVTPPGFAGRFMGDSTILAGGSGGNINTTGESWGMYGGSGGSGNGQSDAYGFLKDGSGNDAALSTGQTVSLEIAVNFRNGYKGVAMRNSGGGELFTFNIGGDDYVVSNATTGNGSIGNSYNPNTVFHIALTQTSAGGGTWEISRSGGVNDFDSGSYTGQISNFKLYVGQTDGGDPNNLMANNIRVIPESGTLGLLLAGTGMLAGFRRRSSHHA